MNTSINLTDYFNDLLQQSNLSFNPLITQFLAAIIVFFCSLIVGWAVFHLLEHYFLRWAKKTKSTLDDEIIKNVKRPIYFLVILIGLRIAVDQLLLLESYAIYIDFIFLSFEILLIAYIITRVINVFLAWSVARKSKLFGKPISANILIVFRRFLHALIYIFGFLIILYISKVDLSGVIVGLGVGGIAIAFALQNVLSDMFSAFSIYFDQPFEIGDFIVIGDDAGTVSHVSMKSTRIKLLRGEELVISNKSILDKSIHNYKKLQKRRVVFTIGVTYNTSVEKLKKIETIIRQIIGKCKICEVDRIHFKEFGAFSLNYEIVYFIDSADYNQYMNVQQDINFGIAEAFEKEGIEFAYPTQTIILGHNK